MPQMKQFSIVSIETVCTIARLGSFTAAAERLHSSQPAISARVRDLESSLGAQLFQRRGRGVALTVAGREFVRKAEPLLHQLGNLVAASQPLASFDGAIRVGMGHITMSWFPELVSRLRRLIPGIRFEIDLDQHGFLVNKLESGQLDVIVVAGPVDARKFSSTSIGTDRLLWVATPRGLAAVGSSDPRRIFAEVPVWCLPVDSHYTQLAIDRVLPFGLVPDRINVINNMAAQMQMILADDGLGLVSQRMARDALQRGQLCVLPPETQPIDPLRFSVVRSVVTAHPVVLRVVEDALGLALLDRQRETGDKDDLLPGC
jgi:DNA-binding transcriptional LysR family regulator